jgi:hypothetical protein
LAAVADLLVAADTQAQVQEAVFFAGAHLLNLEVDLLFFDITSTFFQREARRWARVYGRSKCSSRAEARLDGKFCCRPPIPTCRLPTSRSATSICCRPNAPSVT